MDFKIVKQFNILTLDEKIDFFLNVQVLLVKYHSDSHFVFREDNKQIRKDVTVEFIKNYKGYFFQDENISILFNKIYVDDPNKVLDNFNIYQEPSQNYNTIQIDFVAFKELKDVEFFCRLQYSAQLKWIVYIKNKKAHIFESEKLLTNLGIDFDQIS